MTIEKALVRTTIVGAIAFALVGGSSSPAFAQPAPAPAPADREAEAGEHFRRGIDFYKQRDLKLALIEFDRAYAIQPSYRVLYNIGQVNFDLGSYSRALVAFRRYLQEGGAEIAADRRAAVERDISALVQRVANVKVTSNVDGTEVFVDDTPAGKTPLAEAVLVDAGQHTLRFAAPGYESQTRTVVLAGRDETSVDVKLTKNTILVVAPQAPTRSSVPLVLAWTATGVFTTTAVVTGLLSLNSQSSLESLRDGNTYVSQTELDGVASRAKTYAVIADIAMVGAIVAGGFALYFTFKPAPSPPPESSPAAGKTTSPRKSEGVRARFLGSGVVGTF